MRTNLSKILLLAVLLCGIVICFASHADLKITADTVQFQPGQSTATAKGKVHISYGGYSLDCDEVHLNRETMDYAAKGHVVATIEGRGTWKADAVKGNLKNKEIEFGPYRLDTDVWHVTGADGTTLPNGDHQGHDVSLSTCDKETPHYSLGATTVTFDPKKKTFTSWNNVFRVGSVPIFYLPYIWGTTDNSSGIIFKPGYSGGRGAFMRLGLAQTHGENGTSQIFTDIMTKRGVAIGEMTKYDTENREIRTDMYALHDQDPPETEHGRNRRFKSKSDRYRAHLYWREQFNDNWSVRLNADLLSDISMLEDWFKRDHRNIEQPKSFINLSYDNSWMNMSLDFRPRINTFYTVVEKLPELKLTIPERRLFDDLPIMYSSENTVGYNSMKWRNYDYRRSMFINENDYDPARHTDPRDYSAFRADTLHTFKSNFDIGDILTLTPRASFRATAYSRTSKKKVTQEQLADNFDADDDNRPHNKSTVTDYDSDGGSKVRFASEYGLEGRSKFYTDWNDFQCDWLNITTTRHVIEPYFNYTFAPEPSVSRDNIYFFDEVDRLQRQNFLRVGVDQRWQSRDAKTGDIRTVLSWQTYTDVHGNKGKETNRYWGDWGNRIEFSPWDTFSAWGVLLHDVGAGNIQRGELGTRIGAKDAIHFTGRYVYRNNHLSRSVYSMGSSLVDFTGESNYIKKHFKTTDTLDGTLFLPLNEKTSLEISAEYDFEHCRFAEHHYLLTRELHCWTACLGAGWNYHDFEIMVLLRLTAFPKVKLDLNI